MKKSDMGMGLGAAALLAVCCAGHLLLLMLAGSGLALLTGQTVVVAAAVALAVAAVSIYAWRRSRQCGEEACASQVTAPDVHSRVDAQTPIEAPRERELVTTSRRNGR